jgi:hypothetical protein
MLYRFPGKRDTDLLNAHQSAPLTERRLRLFQNVRLNRIGPSARHVVDDFLKQET